MQHGKALSKEGNAKRPLSAEGETESRRVARSLEAIGVSVCCIWHSDKLRSAETAAIISEHVEHSAMEERKDLDPLAPVYPFRKEIESCGEDLMIVGHMPFLGKLFSLLLTGKDSFELLHFRNSVVVCLEYKDSWSLAWAIPPEINFDK